MSAGLGNIDILLRDNGGDTALDYARWRRDNNQLWSDDVRNPDEDPSAWYSIFEELVDSTLKAK